MTQDTLEMLPTRVSTSVIEQLDRIALARKVNRSIVVRWALDAYIEAFFSPSRLLNEQNNIQVSIDQPAADA